MIVIYSQYTIITGCYNVDCDNYSCYDALQSMTVLNQIILLEKFANNKVNITESKILTQSIPHSAACC